MIAASAAITGYNDSGGDMHIMGSSSASGTVAAGPNGTDYRVKISEIASQGANQTTINNESVKLVEKTADTVNFTGRIRAPTPCHTLTHEIDMKGGTLHLDIGLESSGNPCMQQVVMKDYRGYVEFEAEGETKVVVSHRGKKMDSFETERVYRNGDKKPVKKNSFLDGFMSWLSGLF